MRCDSATVGAESAAASGEVTRLSLCLLACHTALIIARTRHASDIDRLLVSLSHDLEPVALDCPEVAMALRLIVSQQGGEADTHDPGTVMMRLADLRKRLQHACFAV